MIGRQMIRSLFNLVAPANCAVCRKLLPEQAELSACSECRLALDPPGPRCRFCAAPVDGSGSTANCDHCQGERFRFERVIALGTYDSVLMRSVMQVKSAEHHRLAVLLGDLLAARCQNLLADDDRPQVAVSAPMRWGHRLLRGANSPEVMAVRIAAVLRIPAVLDGLCWQRRIQQQRSLAPSLRRRNTRGAMRASASYDYVGHHILFVDDVLTTGATANEAARALLEAGARRVTVAAAARGLGE